MTEPIIEAANVSKIFGSGPARVQALKDVNLTLNGGKLTVLMGPSGSGKTTLLSILGCMLAPTERDGADLRHLRRRGAPGRAREDPTAAYRLRVSVLSPVLDPHGRRKCPAGARRARRARAQGDGENRGGAGQRRPGIQNGVLSAPAQRRRATAGRDRARHRGGAFGHSRRRADRRARRRQRARHHGDSLHDRQGARPRRPGGDSRSAAVRICRPDRPHFTSRHAAARRPPRASARYRPRFPARSRRTRTDPGPPDR